MWDTAGPVVTIPAAGLRLSYSVRGTADNRHAEPVVSERPMVDCADKYGDEPADEEN
jgi:hypothetical protein